VERPLRLAHVTHWPVPHQDTATIQIVHTLAALSELGVSAELLSPRRPWRRARPLQILRDDIAAYYGVPVPRFVPRELPSLFPAPQLISRLLHARLAAAAARNADILYSRDLEAAWVGLKAGRRVVFETFRPETRRSAFHRRVLKRMAASPRFLGIVSHSRYAAEPFVADGLPPEKVRVIYNGFDPRPFGVTRSAVEARRALGLPEEPTVVYLGAIAPYKSLDLLLDAARRTPEIRWVLGGNHQAPAAQPLVASGAALPNVSFPGFVSGERLALLLQAGDVLVIPPSADPLLRFGRTVLPIKLFQYLAAGRAIVTGDLPDTAELLAQDRNSVRVPPDDPQLFAETIRALLRDAPRRERLGDAARLDAKRFTWEARGKAFLSFLQERLEQTSGR
jgi:glycosyltransferase involved in cell wall biosynthesis